MKSKNVLVAAMLAALPLLSGCASGIKAAQYAPRELGDATRAESATVLSQRYVKIRNWNGTSNRSARANAINYIIKLDRTGETLSVTQTNDVAIATGAAAWVEFGDKIRLLPRS
jgi:hypothetical protein